MKKTLMAFFAHGCSDAFNFTRLQGCVYIERTQRADIQNWLLYRIGLFQNTSV